MNVSIYLNFWKYTEPLSVENFIFLLNNERKKGVFAEIN